MSATASVREAAAPVSVAQEGLWYLSRLAPQSISYNETISIRKDGPLDLAALRHGFNEIVRRHEAWRTTFETFVGEPVGVVHPAPRFELPVLDLSALSGEQAEHQAAQLVAAASRVPYDLRHGPLLRPRLVRFPGEHHRLYLAMHHLIFDGVSIYRVVLPELVALYDAFCAGDPDPLPAPAASYADYARWEQTWIAGPRATRRLAHWQEHLTPAPVLSLPLDRPRPPAPRWRGGVIPVSMPRETVAGLRSVGQRSGSTLFQTLASVWSVLLQRYSGQGEVVFAVAADLRQRPEHQAVVGYSLTPLVLRIDLSDDPSFADLLVRVRNELLDGLDNLVPFERLVRELDPPDRSAGANPVYQTMLVLEPTTAAPDSAWSLHQMESEIGNLVGAAKLDLELELDERPDGAIAGRLIYDRDLFETATATRIAAHFSQLTGAVAADPTLTLSAIPMLSAAERHRVLVEWNATTTEIESRPLHELFEARATRQPDARAVSAGEQTITYGELEARAQAHAEELRRAGTRPGDVVALGSEPSIELIAAVLGVLKAGAAYQLLDPAGPEAELAAMGSAEEAACSVQCTARDGSLLAVATNHAAVVNLATAMATELGIGPPDTVLSLRSRDFADHALELWMPLLAGARILLPPATVAGDGRRLSRLMAAEGVSFVHASPGGWQTLVETGLKARRGLKALSVGGPLSRELADQILQRCQVLWNGYGSVETTGCATLGRVEEAGRITIGRPIANTRAYIRDEHRQPAPIGVAGDLVVAGQGVVSGYLNHAQRSAERFLEDPFGPASAYRTGDRARWRPDGELELVSELSRRAAAGGPAA